MTEKPHPWAAVLQGGAMDGMEVKVDPQESIWTARAIYQYHPNPDVKMPAAVSYVRTESVDEAGRSVFVPAVELGNDS